MTAAVTLPDLVGATVTLPSGQTRLVLPGVPRSPYPTGVQVACAACTRAGRPRLGLPYRFPDDPTPLCMRCWRSEQDRRRRAADEELLAAYWDTVGGVEVDSDGPATVAEVRAQACPACGQDEPGPSCWLCAYTWLAWAREQFELDQAAQAAETQRQFDAMVELTRAEDRVKDLTTWVQRLTDVIEAYRDPRGPGRRGRAVELLADLLARDAAARTTKRGRPSALPRVAGVVAVSADYRSGRRSFPGRERCAQLAGCAVGAVSAAWARGEALGWQVRTQQGRRLTLAERVETGRANNRAEFDLAPLHHGDPAVRAPYIPVALLVLDDLLDRAQTLLGEAQDQVDTLIARTGTTPIDLAEMVRRAKLRAAVARARETALSGVESLATATLLAGDHATNIRTPHMVSKGEYLSSCLIWGFTRSPKISSGTDHGNRPSGRRKSAASRRTPTRRGRGTSNGSHRLARPRTAEEACEAPRTKRRAPHWAGWAYGLARAVQECWEWLRGAPLPRVAATLGAALGPDWTAQALDRWVHQTRKRPLLMEPRDPLAYLRSILEDAFTGPHAPPHPARRHTEHCRQLAATAADEQAAAHQQLRAHLDARDAAASTGEARAAGIAAARAAIRRPT